MGCSLGGVGADGAGERLLVVLGPSPDAFFGGVGAQTEGMRQALSAVKAGRCRGAGLGFTS